jgi:cytochrome c-type biogenesis protein CcmF
MEVDSEKRMIFADVDVSKDGAALGRISPAKYIYKTTPDPSTEPAIRRRAQNDLYAIIGMVNPTTKVASFQLHVNPFLSLLWIGAAILVLGSTVAMWPEVSLEEAGAWSYVRAGASVAASVAFGLLLAGGGSVAYASELRSVSQAAADAPLVEAPDIPGAPAEQGLAPSAVGVE